MATTTVWHVWGDDSKRRVGEKREKRGKMEGGEREKRKRKREREKRKREREIELTWWPVFSCCTAGSSLTGILRCSPGTIDNRGGQHNTLTILLTTLYTHYIVQPLVLPTTYVENSLSLFLSFFNCFFPPSISREMKGGATDTDEPLIDGWDLLHNSNHQPATTFSNKNGGHLSKDFPKKTVCLNEDTSLTPTLS